MDVRCEILLDVPVDVAFAYYCDENRLQEWVSGGSMVEFTPLSRPPKGVGSRYRMVYRLMTCACNRSIAACRSGSHMLMDVHAELRWGPLGSWRAGSPHR
jgi:hypothetical protein